MIRTQIQLTPEQAKWLKQKAAELNISLSEIVRMNLDASMKQGGLSNQNDLRKKAMQAAGALKGSPNLAENHDQH